jgi:hypothetical protein
MLASRRKRQAGKKRLATTAKQEKKQRKAKVKTPGAAIAGKTSA